MALYAKLLCTKMEFHIKVRASCVVYHATGSSHCVKKEALNLQKYVLLQHQEIPPNLEVTDEVLERTAGTDINNV